MTERWEYGTLYVASVVGPSSNVSGHTWAAFDTLEGVSSGHHLNALHAWNVAGHDGWQIGTIDATGDHDNLPPVVTGSIFSDHPEGVVVLSWESRIMRRVVAD